MGGGGEKRGGISIVLLLIGYNGCREYTPGSPEQNGEK